MLRASQENDVIFVGPNGSGKSRALRDLCLERINEGHRVIAVSNTQFSRLPDFTRKNYSHVHVNPSMTNDILKGLIVDALDAKSRSFSSMREVLSYTGYSTEIHVRISIGGLADLNPRYVLEAIRENFGENEVNEEIQQVAENLHRIPGEHYFDLENIYSLFSKNELVALLLKHQITFNRALRLLKRKVSASFLLTRTDNVRVPVHKASSGELTLISLAMFVLSQSDKLDYVFIDEPENSLHPQWQSNFLDFISSVARRETIKYHFASHSPVLLTGALTSGRKVKVIRCRPDGVDELKYFQKENDDSVEELLWEAFDVITPASRFVAKQVSDLLWKIEEGRIKKVNGCRESAKLHSQIRKL